MPLTRSELLYFSAGVAVGAWGHAALPKLKEKFGPVIAAVIAGAGSGAGDAYSELAKSFAEKVENVQDAMSEMKAAAAKNGSHNPTASSV